MKKISLKIMSAVSIVLVLLVFASGCSLTNKEVDFSALYKTAVENSMKADVFYWKEQTVSGNENTYTHANVLAEFSDGGDVLRSDDGSYKNFRIHIQERKNDKKFLDMVVGTSGKSGKNGGEQKDILFIDRLENGESVSKEMEPYTAAQFYEGEQFKPYLLSNKIAELEYLTYDDMNFDTSDGKRVHKGKLTQLVFEIKPEYLERYKAENGKESLFAKAHYVSIEMAFDRITHVIVYQKGDLKGLLEFDVEAYKLEVVYLGPKIAVPSFSETKEDGTPVWKEKELA